MTSAAAPAIQISQEDALRAHLYDFLGALLAAPPRQALLTQAAGLTGDQTDLGRGITALATIAAKTSPAKAEAEFNALFIGLGRGELLPFASYYMTGFLNEKPLAGLRRDMSRLRIARAPNVYEPEDNIASLMEMMAGLIDGRFGRAAGLDQQQEFFARHIAPWAPHFMTDLEAAKGSVLYAPIGLIGRVFLHIEQEAFRLEGQTAERSQ